MMSAILKIKPQIDQNDAKKMEKSLFDRFKNIGKTMKKTLKDVVTGGFLGFAVGLAQSMLSPIEEVETRIKGMLEKASDLKELASEFNTSPGKLDRLQNQASLQGLKPEALRSMMSSFRDAVEEAQEKIRKKEPLDEKTSLVKAWVGSKDMAEAFFNFAQTLKQVNSDKRDAVEKAVFGSVQRGASRSFINSSGLFYPEITKKGTDKTSTEIRDLDNKNFNYQIQKILQDQMELTNYSNSLNSKYINMMVDYENRQKAKEVRQLKNYEELAAARLAVDKLNGIMEKVTELLTTLVKHLGTFITFLQNSPMTKGFMKMIGVK